MRKYGNKSQLLILVFVVGFFVGILYENIVSGTNGGTSEIFTWNYLQQFSQMEILTQQYFPYVIKTRVLLLCFCCLLGCVKWKRLYAVMCLGLFSFCVGSFTTGAVLQMGAKGLLLCFAGIFPQGLFYGLIYSLLLLYWYHYPERRFHRAKLVFVLVMFLSGVLLETYINPLILKWVIGMM